MEIKSNGKKSFDAVYDAHVEKVYQIALYYSGNNHHVAEEITQDVFMKLYICMDNDDVKNVENWLKIAAKHAAMNYQRDHHREILLDDMVNTMDKIVSIGNVEDDIVDCLKRNERRAFVEDIYSELYEENPHWHEAVLVTYALDMPQKEAAESMGLSFGTFRMMLLRAKNWIRKRYQKQYDHLDEA